MAYRRVQLKNIIRQRCDLENTTFETETELDQHINDAAAVLHDLLISCAGENYAIATTTVTTAAGTKTTRLRLRISTDRFECHWNSMTTTTRSVGMNARAL